MTQHPRHTEAAAGLTALILEIFRLNGDLLAAGDRLTRPFGLSSARWQVMGAIELEGRPLSVAQIARRMGLSRQAVQRLANELAADGFLRFADNPDHARARLAALTARAETALAGIGAAQVTWSNRLTEGISADEIGAALDLLRRIRHAGEAVSAATGSDEPE
jgi:DNA-binding MarR family transcriptional regulator